LRDGVYSRTISDFQRQGQRDALNIYRTSNRFWTYLSPAEQIYPGERTGRFRLGGDQPVTDAKGESRISFEDFAGAQVIIYGGYSSEKFDLHNFDVLMKDSTIKSYVYRYFFTPPPAGDRQLLQEITDISGQADFKVPVAGLHPLEDFRTAIYESVNHSENGKRFFQMQW
jgi:hypothetical protein